MKKVIELGSKVRDSITSFEGTVTSRTEYLNGCVRYGVQSNNLKDGKTIDPEWFDIQQLTVIEEPSLSCDDAENKETDSVGGPGDVPTPYPTPR